MRPGLQREAKALGDPTRHRLFRIIADADRPLGIADLADQLGVHHNAVRQHLAILHEAALVVEVADRARRPGRPRLLYRVHPTVPERWDAPGPYEQLAGLLAGALDGAAARLVGRDEGRRSVSTPTADRSDPVDVIEDEMARRGFEPVRTIRRNRVDLVLGTCPFERVAIAAPDAICQLHLGLAEGLADALGGVDVEGLQARHPHRAGCRLTLRRAPAAVSREEPATKGGR